MTINDDLATCCDLYPDCLHVVQSDEAMIDPETGEAFLLKPEAVWRRRAEAAEAKVARLEQENSRLTFSSEHRFVELGKADDRIARLEEGLRPFVEDYDFHAAPYLADNVDGEEARVFTARTVESLIEHQRVARRALAGDTKEARDA